MTDFPPADHFKNGGFSDVQYYQRADHFGGHLYVHVRREGARNILYLGCDEDGSEFAIKFVKTDKEIQEFVHAIRS